MDGRKPDLRVGIRVFDSQSKFGNIALRGSGKVCANMSTWLELLPMNDKRRFGLQSSNTILGKPAS